MLQRTILPACGLLLFLFSAGSLADPNQNQTGNCPDGWTFYEQSCYILVKENLTWPVAQGVCETLGAHLVTIANQNENNAARNIVEPLGKSGVLDVWIGLHDMVRDEHYQWVTSNREATYTDWGAGQPNGVRDGAIENCVAFRKLDLKWHDFPCSTEFQFICESSI